VKTSVRKAKEVTQKAKQEKESISSVQKNDTLESKNPENNEKSLLKSILKDKLANKIQQKEDEQTIRQLHINFPKNKPTFSIDLLDKNMNP